MGDKPLVPSYVIDQGLVNPCLTRGADFEAYTASMNIDENVDPGHFVVTMIGSSTVTDLQGDTMTMSALDDMTKIPDNLSVFLNHQYNLPEDLFGGLYGRPWIKSQSGIADLHLSSEVESSNPRAMQTYAMISKGRRLGCSIGCQVLDYDYDQATNALIIQRVLVIEYSVVGVPAQQRCWVEVATKSLFERALIDGRGDDALQLAPAVRGMYSRSYNNILKHIESDGLKKDLERTAPRGTAQNRIMHIFNDGEIGFALADGKGIKKSLTRTEVSDLLAKSVPVAEPAQITMPVVETNIEPDETKSASGKSDWPLGDRGEAWDGSESHNAIVKWATKDDDSLDTGKLKSVHFWYDQSAPDKIGSYKLAFCDIKNGSPVAIPRGIFACAGAIQGARGTGVDIPDSDVSGVKAKIAAYYNRMAKEFDDDSIVPPWENSDAKKSLNDDEISKDILDSNSGGALDRQDLGEKPKVEDDEDVGKNKSFPKAADVSVSADGTHEACEGTHTHAHKAYGVQGDDESHEHEHTHSGDADHGHHDASASDDTTEKSAEENVEATKSVELTEETKSAEENVELAKADNVSAMVVIDPQKAALLGVYNDLGKQLGFAPASFEPVAPTQKSLEMPIADGVNPQDIVTALSIADSNIDWLMSALNVPDIDVDDDGDAFEDDRSGDESNGVVAVSSPFMARNSLDISFVKALSGILVKEGKELNEKNRSLVKSMHDYGKAIHDVCAGMHPDCCKCDDPQEQTVYEAENDARMQGEGQPVQPIFDYSSYSAGIESINNLAKAFEQTNLLQIVKSAASEEVNAAFAEMRKSADNLARQQSMLIERVKKLQEMPLGRPTNFVGRSVTVTEGTATIDEMLTAGVNVAEMTDDDLEIVEIPTARGTMKYKKWPMGYKVGQRPSLNDYQKTYMSPLDYMPYETASKDVLVPVMGE